jgi:diguanylate cyclase (GGDEF)-like protein/PAS domain S-box-containing protein
MDNWQPLIGNFAVVALFISAWVHGQFVVAGRHKRVRQLAFGVVMGLGAVATMALAVKSDAGGLLDLRSSVIALAGFFGGPIAGLVAAVFAVAYRLFLGGAAAWLGVVAILFAAVVGVSVSRATRKRVPAMYSAGLLALSVACIGPALSMIFRLTGLSTGSNASLPLALLNAAATAVSAFFFMRQRVLERERDLLRAAFMQSSDFQYVKRPDSRFAVVNKAVAKHHGYDNPEKLVGRSDFDLAEADRADDLFAEEQMALATGEGFEDREEVLSDMTGKPYWFSTSKVPLKNDDGETIGIAGVTRDITARKTLERSLTESRNQLTAVLAGISDGVAMFDKNGVLVYSNEQYSELFPRTAEFRKPGTSLRDILVKVVETKEQIIPTGTEAEWVEEITDSLKHVSEEEVELYDGRWLYIRTRPTADGAALVVVSDVTKIKQAEATLRSMTDQLKLLATTDGLTGLTNRRAFDATLETELARCRRNGEALSLLMVDVDRFKAYNDLYGHQAGDEVLKTVGECLKDALRRPGDVAARYGGEEFVSVLPGTDEDGAFFIADAFREKLAALHLPHKGGDKGFLTASVGLATFTDRDAGMNATELVRRADEALYNAKGAGRDRVTGWRPRHEVRPVRGVRA